MSTDVYTLLIALGSSAITATATLGAVSLTSRHMDRAGQSDRRLQAYATLLVAAGEVSQAYRRLEEVVSSFAERRATDDQAVNAANAQMASLGDSLHRASAVVALTGSEVGRREGKALYQKAKAVAASRVRLVPCLDNDPDDDSDPYVFSVVHPLDDKALDVAIDAYKAAMVPETTALP